MKHGSEPSGEEEWSSEPSREPAPVDDPRDLRVGRYRLCFELASGGMASVLLARADGPAGFRKLVALKRIHPHLAKERPFVEMFLDEAAIAARIDHANVCSVFDFGRDGDTYYIAMEYLFGESLARALKRLATRTLDDPARHARIAAKIVADACEGLHAAHELRGPDGELLDVVHRDVSPENVFVTYDGIAKIVDFGVASASQRIHRTTTGVVKGKHAYMAPELLSDGQLDRRADVWSMGVVLWELLTLERLFRRAAEAQTLFAVVTAPIPPPSEVRSGIPSELDAIVLRALERDPDRRYATARELGRDLQRFIARDPEPITLEDLSEWMRACFGERRERLVQLLEAAQRMPDDAPPMTRARGEGDETSETAASTVVRRDGRRRRRRATIAAGVAVVALIAGLGAWRFSRIAPFEAASPHADRTAAAAREEPREPEQSLEPPEPAAPASNLAANEAAAIEPPETGAAATEETSDARRPRRATGTLMIATPGGWADVYRGRRRLGQTPLTTSLPAGTHVLEVRPFGRAPGIRRTVRVPSAGRAQLVIPVDR